MFPNVNASHTKRLFSSKFDRRVASQFFLVSPSDHFVCPVPSFSEMKEINWMKKSARVSEKLVSPGLPGLQVATRLFDVYLHEFKLPKLVPFHFFQYSSAISCSMLIISVILI